MKILIADDHPLFLNGLKSALQLFNKCVHIDTEENGENALNLLQKGNYDIALIDLKIPIFDGFHILKNNISRTPVLIITASENTAEHKQALNLGAKGIIHKSSSASQINDIIHKTLDGIKTRLTQGANFKSNNIETEIWAQHNNLTSRELEVLLLLYDGYSNQAIADQLFLALATVKSHIHSIYKKLGTKNRNETIKLYLCKS